MKKPAKERQYEPDETAIAEACAIIRRTWTEPHAHVADPEKLVAAKLIAIAAEDMDAIRPHLEILVQRRDAAVKAYRDFKQSLDSCKQRIGIVRNTQRWIVGRENAAAPLGIISETIAETEEDVIRRLLKALDRKTYRYLAELKGSECPLCGAIQ